MAKPTQPVSMRSSFLRCITDDDLCSLYSVETMPEAIVRFQADKETHGWPVVREAFSKGMLPVDLKAYRDNTSYTLSVDCKAAQISSRIQDRIDDSRCDTSRPKTSTLLGDLAAAAVAGYGPELLAAAIAQNPNAALRTIASFVGKDALSEATAAARANDARTPEEREAALAEAKAELAALGQEQTIHRARAAADGLEFGHPVRIALGLDSEEEASAAEDAPTG